MAMLRGAVQALHYSPGFLGSSRGLTLHLSPGLQLCKPSVSTQLCLLLA